MCNPAEVRRLRKINDSEPISDTLTLVKHHADTTTGLFNLNVGSSVADGNTAVHFNPLVTMEYLTRKPNFSDISLARTTC